MGWGRKLPLGSAGRGWQGWKVLEAQASQGRASCFRHLQGSSREGPSDTGLLGLTLQMGEGAGRRPERRMVSSVPSTHLPKEQLKSRYLLSQRNRKG